MYDLSSWTLAHAVRCASHIRRIGARQDVASMEAVAQQITEHLQTSLRTSQGTSAVALARIYRTSAFRNLPPELQRFAQIIGSENQVTVRSRCVGLLGSFGQESAWRRCSTSYARRAIPMASPYILRQIPLMGAMLYEHGVETSDTLAGAYEALRTCVVSRTDATTTYALDTSESALLVDQDFLDTYGVVSAVGMTGRLHDGEVFGAVLYTRVPMSSGWVTSFGLISHAIRVALTPWVRGPIYQGGAS